MKEMKEDQKMTAHSESLEKLFNDLKVIEDEIETSKKNGWLKAIFPLQVEYAITMIKIKSLKNEEINNIVN